MSFRMDPLERRWLCASAQTIAALAVRQPMAALATTLVGPSIQSSNITQKVRADRTIDPSKSIFGIKGFTGFENPLDMVEDRTNGNLYTTELLDERRAGRITLLKQKAPLSLARSSSPLASNAGEMNDVHSKLYSQSEFVLAY